MNERVVELVNKGLKKRKGILVFGLVCGVMIGPGFSVAGLLMKGHIGPLYFWFGVIMTLFLLALLWLVYREGLQKRTILRAVRDGHGIGRVYHVKIQPRAAGPEGKVAEQILNPFHHVFIGHESGAAVRFWLPQQECHELFCLLLRTFPAARYHFPAELAGLVAQQLPRLDPKNHRSQKQVHAEIIRAELRGLVPIS
ncbi:MAG: hypothetical protein JXO51_06415 [Candidatus Aminicenantes bacterium]|nr:hypothetical protein [Candidatus Aminicenantes bacterium]